MNRPNIIFVIICIGVSILTVVAVISAADQTNLAMETIKLAKGKISIFQVLFAYRKGRSRQREL